MKVFSKMVVSGGAEGGHFNRTLCASFSAPGDGDGLIRRDEFLAIVRQLVLGSARGLPSADARVAVDELRERAT